MVEVRQHADGRTAIRLEAPMDDILKGEYDWVSFKFGAKPQQHLSTEPLTHEEVRDWTILVPAGQCAAEARSRLGRAAEDLRNRAKPDGTRNQDRTSK